MGSRRPSPARISGARLPAASSDACTATARTCSRPVASPSTKTTAPSVHAGSPGPAAATSTGLPAMAEARSPSRSAAPAPASGHPSPSFTDLIDPMFGSTVASAAVLDFTDQVVVVTGAGRGLGRLYARELARRGAAVVVNDVGGTMQGAGSDPVVADRVVAEIEAAGGVAARPTTRSTPRRAAGPSSPPPSTVSGGSTRS